MPPATANLRTGLGYPAAEARDISGAIQILRFPDVTDSVEIYIINRPRMPLLGSAEAAQGPTAAAFANAGAHAIGTRLRDIPFSPERVKSAVGVT